MPKRKVVRSNGDNKGEVEGGIEEENSCPVVQKRPRGRPRVTKTASVEAEDKAHEAKSHSKEELLPTDVRRRRSKKLNMSRSTSSDKELSADLSLSCISDDDAREDEDDNDSVFGVDEEKKNEPEKRSLRATNSRRSREAMAKHLLMASSALEAIEGKINSEKVSKKPTSDHSDKIVDLMSAESKTKGKGQETSDEERQTKDAEKPVKINPTAAQTNETEQNEFQSKRGDVEETKNNLEEDTAETEKLNHNHKRNDNDTLNEEKEKGDEELISQLNSEDDNNDRLRETGEENDKMAFNVGQSSTENSSAKTPKNRAKVQNRHGIDFRVGGRLEACDFMANWYASKIVEIDWNEREVLIHFERWSSRFDEWVSMDSPRLRAIARTSARKEHKQKLQQEFKVGENILAKWVDGKMYPAKVVAINSNGSCQVVFYDDGIQKTVRPNNLSKVTKEEFAYQVSQTSGRKSKRRESGGRQSRNLGKGRSTSSDADESPDSGLSRSQSRSLEDSIPLKKLVKPRKSEGKVSSTSSSAYSLAMRKKKLLVGGIFQAKRTFQNPNPRSRPSLAKKPEKLSECKANKTTFTIGSRVKLKPQKDSKPTVNVDDSKPQLSEEVDEAQSSGLADVTNATDESKQRKSSGGAPKEFIIEEDHNHFKCPTENCGKSFRKESLLASHMKHYHDHSPKPRHSRRRESAGVKLEVSNSPSCSDASKSVDDVVVENEEKVADAVVKSIPDEPQQPATVRRKRGFQRSFTKHKMRMAKRRPMLVYRHKPKEQEQADVESDEDMDKPLAVIDKESKKTTNLKEETKKRSVKRSRESTVAQCEVPPVLKDTIKVETIDESQPLATNAIPAVPTSPVNRKIGRKRKWRCSVRSPKNVEPQMNLVSSGANTKPVVGSPEVHSPMERYNIEYDDDDDRREEVVNCICRILEEDGLMMQCETCMAWQHGVCFNIEEEDKVPEKYVCFACKNPEGQRESYRYWYDQDWWKLGEMASFNFVPKDESGLLSAAMLKAHSLAGGVYSVKKLLHCLQQKLDFARDREHSDASLWSKAWCEESLQPKMSGGNWNSPSQDGSRRPAMFLDHSYSAITRKAIESSFTRNAGIDSDSLVKDEKVKEITEKPVNSSSQVFENDENTTDKQDSANRFSTLKDAETNKQAKPRPDTHLLDHVDQMQDEVDHRLDEISQHIEVLEAEWEDGAFGSSSNMSVDLPAIKKMLKGLQANLDKVQRLATFQ